jgi:hypothetical protein
MTSVMEDRDRQSERMFRFGGAEEKVENLEREGGLGIDHQVGC